MVTKEYDNNSLEQINLQKIYLVEKQDYEDGKYLLCNELNVGDKIAAKFSVCRVKNELWVSPLSSEREKEETFWKVEISRYHGNSPVLARFAKDCYLGISDVNNYQSVETSRWIAGGNRRWETISIDGT